MLFIINSQFLLLLLLVLLLLVVVVVVLLVLQLVIKYNFYNTLKNSDQIKTSLSVVSFSLASALETLYNLLHLHCQLFT